MSNLITITIGKLRECITAAVEAGINLIVMGAPGVGKTQIMAQTAEALDMNYAESPLAGRDVDSFFMPYVNPAQGKLEFRYAENIPVEGSRFDNGKHTLYNLDEFSGGVRMLQNIFLKVLDEHTIGNMKLLPNTHIVGTGNRAQDLAHVEQLSAALGNRATFVNVEHDLDAWINYGISKNFHPIVLAWVKFDPTYLLHFVPEQFLAGDPAFCSPRSNERLSLIMHQRDRKGMSDEVFRSLVCGTIGSAIGIKFSGFCKIQSDLPDISKILAGQKQKAPKDPAVIYACLYSLVQQTDRNNLQNVVNFVTDINAEWHQMFADAVTSTKPALTATSVWGKFMTQHANNF